MRPSLTYSCQGVSSPYGVMGIRFLGFHEIPQGTELVATPMSRKIPSWLSMKNRSRLAYRLLATCMKANMQIEQDGMFTEDMNYEL
jgi:hypothetical protein